MQVSFSRDNVSPQSFFPFDFGPFQHHHHPIIRAAQTQETSSDRHSPPRNYFEAVIKGLAPVEPVPCHWMRLRQASPPYSLFEMLETAHRSLSHLHMCCKTVTAEADCSGRLAVGPGELVPLQRKAKVAASDSVSSFESPSRPIRISGGITLPV